MKRFFLFFIVLSTPLYANEIEKDLRLLMNQYFDYVLEENENKLQEILSKEYYQELKKNKILEAIYQKNRKTKPDKSKRAFDLTYKQGAKNKNMYFVNIKPVTAKNYSENWYYIKKDKKKYIIEKAVMLED